MCKSDGALGGNPLLEILKCGGRHLVVTEVFPVDGGGTDKKKSSCGVVMMDRFFFTQCKSFSWNKNYALAHTVHAHILTCRCTRTNL